jgi:rubredoxin
MKPYRKYVCVICAHVYDEEIGDPETNLAPGTRWEDVPESWTCPDCGAGKADFEEAA